VLYLLVRCHVFSVTVVLDMADTEQPPLSRQYPSISIKREKKCS